jgi:ankyrin repeat protein
VHKLLKVKNLDVNEADRATGNVALHYAAAKGHLDIVRTLLTDPRTDPNRENLHNTTPLILAAGNGQMEVVEELLECKRTDPNYEARGPLHVSTHSCYSPAPALRHPGSDGLLVGGERLGLSAQWTPTQSEVARAQFAG